MRSDRILQLLGAVLLLCGSSTALAANRQDLPVIAEVISGKGNEKIQFQGDNTWQTLNAGQTLVAGDYVRTGPYGGLSILFNDQTQIRLHQKSLLRIEDVRKDPAGDENRLSLVDGSLWSRVKRGLLPGHTEGAARVQVITRTAVIGIRGTDWHLRAEGDKRSTLTVLSGEAELSNDEGTVAVRPGEVGIAEPGHAPSKRVLVDLRERPLISMDIEVEWLDMLGDDAAEGTRSEGLALLRQREYAAAGSALKRAVLRPSGRRDRVLAETALAGAEIGGGDFAAAESRLARLLKRNRTEPEPYLLQIWLASFSGDQDKAITLAQTGAELFPQDGRFPALLAHLYFVTDDPAQMRVAADTAIATEPEQPFTWHVMGLYHQYARPDAQAAKRAYLRAVQAKSSYSPSWNNLGLLYLDLADYAAAEQAFQAAMRGDPYSTRARANYGFLLAVLNRLTEAELVFAEVLAQKPDEPYGLLGLGYLDLLQEKPAEGTQKILEATTVYPELPGGSSSLAAAYYQAGEYGKAKQELENARRLDPDDPVPDVMGSIMAVDHYQAGEAIELARQGFEKTLKTESFAVDSLANAKSGSATLGNAFSNLGLHEWGGYYTELAFDPYLANGYFYLSQREQFDSERARLGANRQGLLLDPLAASAPTRYYEPYRQPRNDVSLFGQLGSEKSALFHAESVTFQGFERSPETTAYFVQLANTDDEGVRDNSAAGNQSLFGQLGTSWDSRRHNLFLEMDIQNFDEELPGSSFDPDLNDRSNNRFAFLGVGYQYRLNFNNRVLARAVAGVERRRIHTNDEQLLALSNRDFSLLSAVDFDLLTVRDLYFLGLRDVTPGYGGSNPNNPDFDVGGACPTCVGLALFDLIPAGIDVDQTLDDNFKSQNYALQVRHLLDLDPVEFSYGAEINSIRDKETLTSVQMDPLGLACLAFAPPDPGPACPAVDGFPFVFGSPTVERLRFDNDIKATQIYTQARWKVTPEFWAEGGLFYRNLEVDFESTAIQDISESQVDPRLGLGWRISPRQWLRLAYQGELLFPLRTADSLAPVATLGLVLPENHITLLEGGPKVKDLQARWDAEWQPWLFTHLSFEQQSVRDFQVGGFFYEQGQIHSTQLGANLLLLKNVGLAVSQRWNGSEDTSGGVFDGNDLVIVPDSSFDVALTWVSPSQLRLILAASRVGERFDDPANIEELRAHWTARTLFEWEPGLKHWFFSAGVNNLLDKEFELASGFAGPRRFYFVTTEYRF